MKILIIHAHPEPESFCTSQMKVCVEAFEKSGHDVRVKDLFKENFNPVAGKGDFARINNKKFFKLQAEQFLAAKGEKAEFSEELKKEIEILRWCDLLILSFPLWWFSLPAMLKGYLDRVFAGGITYSAGDIFENGLLAPRKGMVLTTTGGPEFMYGTYGISGDINDKVLWSIHHSVFFFTGLTPLKPVVSFSPAQLTDEKRKSMLEQVHLDMRKITTRETIDFRPTSDYEQLVLKKEFRGAQHDIHLRKQTPLKKESGDVLSGASLNTEQKLTWNMLGHLLKEVNVLKKEVSELKGERPAGAVVKKQKKVLIFGATGNIGSRVARMSIDKGYEVVGFTRRESKNQDPMENPNYSAFRGAYDSEKDITEVMDGVDAIIISIGVVDTSRPFDDISKATALILKVAEKKNVPRIIFLGAAVVLIPERYVPPGLSFQKQEHGAAYDMMKASALDYLFVAPTIFSDEPSKDFNYRVEVDGIPKNSGQVCRDDVAHFMVESVEDDKYHRCLCGLSN